MDQTISEATAAKPETFTKSMESTAEHTKELLENFLDWLKTYLTWNNLFKVVGAVLICLIIWGIYRLILHLVKKVPAEKISKQTSHVISKALKYAFYIILGMYILGLFGVKLSAIWGAAGIAGVAIGFAAQTSVSNIISGIFVLTEKSIKVGDTIIVDGITGIVDSVNLLSIRVHTHDNQMVRIPNSTVINSNLTNNSYHNKRRLTINVSIAYNTDMQLALETLLKAPDYCEHVLKDPAPIAWYDGFGDSGINLTIALWFNPADFITAKNEAYIAIKKVFDEAGIEIPFNQLDVMIKNNSATVNA